MTLRDFPLRRPPVLHRETLRKFFFLAKDLAKVYFDVVVTSSTAQGGGGSSKNRKPIGEVGCCESDARTNPLMDRKVVGVVFFGVVAMIAVVTSPQLLDVVWSSAVVVVVVV